MNTNTFQIRGLAQPIALSESADQPTRIPLAMVGTFYKDKLKFTISQADIATMAANFAKRGNGEVVLDYEHATQWPEVAAGGPIPAAGWIVAVDDKPDASGVAWGNVNFTPRAAGLIAAKEYKYVSPVLSWGSRDKSTGEPQGLTLTSAALTNTPVLDRMPAIRLSESTKEGESKVATKETVMCSEHPKTAMLCPQCDKDTIDSLAASEAARRGPKVLQLSDAKRDAKGRIDLSSVGGDVVISIGLHNSILNEKVALSEVAEAVKAGKVLPAQREYFEKLALSDVETFRGLVKTMGQQVDLSERGQGGEGAGLSELAQLDVRLDTMARAKAKDAGIPYGDAVKIVASEHPDLNRRRTVLTRQALSNHGGDED